MAAQPRADARIPTVTGRVVSLILVRPCVTRQTADTRGVNPLFDDHLTHASAHTESLWLTRWAREVEGMGSAAARHAAGGGSIELRLVELGHPECQFWQLLRASHARRGPP